MFEEFWWIFPLIMIFLCFYVMRGNNGSVMCGFGSHNQGSHLINNSDSAREILEKRYAIGEIDKDEYEEKKKELNHSG